MGPSRVLGALTLAALLSCASAPPEEEREDLGALLAMLAGRDPRRREEAIQRLLIEGHTVREFLEDRARDGMPEERAAAPRALSLVDEDTEAMGAEIDGVYESREGSYQKRLWQAYHVLRGGSLGRDWGRLSESLARQGFRLIEIYEPHERSKFTRFLARAGAYADAAGNKYDLFFWVQVRKGPSPGTRSSWVVREVYVGLHGAPKAPYKRTVGEDRHLRGSVLALFLERPEVQKLAALYPTLEEIELAYGRIRSRESEAVPAGFHVNASFVRPGEGKSGGRAVYYTAESGLDPLEGRRGRLRWEGFRLDEGLGALTPRGGSFWGPAGLRPQDE